LAGRSAAWWEEEFGLRDHQSWNGGKILVAEDNFLLGEVVCEFLHECGLAPQGPYLTVDAALAAARTDLLDGAVLDVKLGGNLCFPICSVLQVRAIPFIFLTGYRDLSMIPAELKSAPLICKPFETSEMKSALAAMLKLDERLYGIEPRQPFRN
jgi:DNA-binding response OmpR family regulator